MTRMPKASRTFFSIVHEESVTIFTFVIIFSLSFFNKMPYSC
ncbi:hypothetical protein CU019_1375 [Enterococcus faecium]|nr:hypothetical protein [Enterococcus faecium]MBK4790373.1 hypothetical protein [Enterococcus faecium]MBK4798576.1 hypothetical protein [Enterococcus faecium]MBK4803666.1 hypothetical protein [Enterococcus faecium]